MMLIVCVVCEMCVCGGVVLVWACGRAKCKVVIKAVRLLNF